MFAVIGIVILFACLLIGYTMHGGKIAALMQVNEFIIIGGAALGSVVVGYGMKGAIGLVKSSLGLLKGNPYKKQTFLDLLRAMYDVFVTARKDGLLALEKHVEKPSESDLFKKHPAILGHHNALDFMTDTLKVVIMGGVNFQDLSELMDLDLESQHEEGMKMPGILSSVGDSMPGFGIVAAVLGVVITMQAIGGPPEEIGEKVGAALVGTFLGVLLAYGVFAPLAKATEQIAKCESQYLSSMKQALVAFARGDTPVMCVEFARRSIEPDLRPTFKDLEDACRSKGGAKAEAAAPEAAAA